MFEETKLLGISMAPRPNRRALVAITYAVTIALLSLLPLTGLMQLSAWVAVPAYVVAGLWYLLLPIIGRGVFGRFVRSGFRPFIGPPPRPVQTSLGLGATVPADEPAVDERELAVRNHAYYVAYKGLAVGTFFVFWLVSLLVQSDSRMAFLAMVMALALFLVVAFTLPQAVILWTEPDLFE